MAQLTENNYTLRVTTSDFDAGINVFLQDNYLNTETLLGVNSSSDVNFVTNSTAASKAADRFRILLRQSGVLPVSIVSVKAYQNNAAVQVEWSVGNQQGNKCYEVEKSVDGTRFTKAGTVIAASQSKYNWTDLTPVNGSNYYRIKIVGLDDSYKLSQVVNVKIGGSGINIVNIANPVRNKTLMLQLENIAKGDYNITLYNNLGQQLISRKLSHGGGSSTQLISLEKILPGSYQLSVQGDNHFKIVKSLIVE